MGEFGSLVRQLRKEKNYVLEFVARKIGSHKGYLSGIENGKVKPPSARFVRKLARVLEFDEKELLKRAFMEKIPALVREEFEEAMQLYAKEGGKGDTDLVPSVRIPLLCNEETGYPTQISKEGNPVSLTKSHILMPKMDGDIRYALYVADDEMMTNSFPSFAPGDVLFLSTTASFKSRDVVFIVYTVNGKPVSKVRDFQFKPGGKVLLQPWNKKYPQETINWDDVDLLLKVVKHCYSLDRDKKMVKAPV